MCSDILYNFETVIIKGIHQDIVINVQSSSCKVRNYYSSQILMTLEFSRQILEKYSNTKFHENPSFGSRVVPCSRVEGQTDRRTDMTNFSQFRESP